MTIINEPVSKAQLKEMAHEFYGDMVKGVVDVGRKILALNAELHADLEKLLLEDSSIRKVIRLIVDNLVK